MKRLLSLALAALMMFPAIPLSASAAEPEENYALRVDAGPKDEESHAWVR